MHRGINTSIFRIAVSLSAQNNKYFVYALDNNCSGKDDVLAEIDSILNNNKESKGTNVNHDLEKEIQNMEKTLAIPGDKDKSKTETATVCVDNSSANKNTPSHPNIENKQQNNTYNDYIKQLETLLMSHGDKKQLSASGQKYCYVISSETPINQDILSQIGTHKAYKNAFNGVSFCTEDKEILNKINDKKNAIVIEENKMYRTSYLGSKRNANKNSSGLRLLFREYIKSWSTLSNSVSLTNKQDSIKNSNNNSNNSSNKNSNKSSSANAKSTSSTSYKMKHIPTFLYKIRNTGNLIFNNLLLDNFVVRWLGIRYLLRYLYVYKYHNGSVPMVLFSNTHLDVAQNVVVVNENTELSLIDILDIIENKIYSGLSNQRYVVVFDIEGPQSQLLNKAVASLAEKHLVITAGGNNMGNSCESSPYSSNSIRVGSVNKYGGISSFSSAGDCNFIYVLGKDVYSGGSNHTGTGMSAQIVGWAAAEFLGNAASTSPNVSAVKEWLVKNSMRSNQGYNILKIGEEMLYEDEKSYHFYSIWYIVAILIVIVLIVAILIYRKKRSSPSGNAVPKNRNATSNESLRDSRFINSKIVRNYK
ncbi:hypothetical protein ENBRE01_0766 [Enteropsectra breve]|nr:hypothetical protein ENBRE01_0766 [Enteropsectra breve]